MHIPVLLEETISILDPKPGNIFVDGTIGSGGHSKAVAEKLGRGIILGIDEDQTALVRSRGALIGASAKIILSEGNFRHMDEHLRAAHLNGADRMLFDLGMSSDQLEQSGRGFSFKSDEPLLMTLPIIPREGQTTALEIVHTWSEESLADLFKTYGEERFAKRIAKGIVLERARGVISTAKALADTVMKNVPAFYRRGKTHPATKVFQALRIAVNDELGALREGLNKASDLLRKNGRLAVITFHSLEDRMVKNFFRELAQSGDFKLLTKKPIIAGRDEIKANPRARSAKLRAVEKIS